MQTLLVWAKGVCRRTQQQDSCKSWITREQLGQLTLDDSKGSQTEDVTPSTKHTQVCPPPPTTHTCSLHTLALL